MLQLRYYSCRHRSLMTRLYGAMSNDLHMRLSIDCKHQDCSVTHHRKNRTSSDWAVAVSTTDLNGEITSLKSICRINYELARCLPPFITGGSSDSGPVWTGLQARLG